MILSHRVALNGVELDSLDNRILIQRVETTAGKEQISAVSLWGGCGQRVTGRHRDTLDVNVTFSLRIKNGDMDGRSKLLEAVCAWAAGGGWLTVNYKTGRRIRVMCAQLPAEGDLWDWTARFTIVFRAYEVPYWQETVQTTVVKTNVSSSTFTYTAAGSAETVMDVEFENTSGSSCSTFTITAGESTIDLESIDLAAGEKLQITHDGDGRLSILIDNAGVKRSVMDKRSDDSSDDLYISPGAVSVSMTAQRAGKLTVGCYGRFAG